MPMFGVFQVDALGRDVLDVYRMVRSWRNRLAPINRVPPEVLTLIPDFWDEYSREEIAITLTHVCRAWRKIFIACPSLWTNFDCADAEKTLAYLERSRSSPINLRLNREDGLFPEDPFLHITPRAVARLRYLSIFTEPDHLQDITDHLSCPAPLLEDLSIFGSNNDPFLYSVLTPALFDRNLSPLRELSLFSVQTELPWRNMVNLTNFVLGYVLEPRVTIGQLLDFFESAPRLLDVELFFSTPAFGAQNGRLVSLAHLKKLHIYGFHPPSLLLDHLLIPVGAKMTTNLDLPGPQIEDHLPRSLDNLRNLSNFTKICLRFEHWVSMIFTGPNGQVCMASMCPRPDATRLVPRSLALFDTSKTKRLEIIKGHLSEDLRRALLSIRNLQVLTLSLCKDLHSFILALSPDPSPIIPIPCAKLAGLVFRTEERFDIETMVDVAAARALAGAPFKSVRIIHRGELSPEEEVMELRKYVLDVETSVEPKTGEVEFSC